jgi:hypothetical protein
LIIGVFELEKVLFGDNQFFGVNHMSEEKARSQAMRFQDIAEVIRVIDLAYDEGIHAFMCTTHDRIAEVCKHVKANPSRYKDFVFYPCMPYAHKYANAVTELGPIEALRKFLPEGGAISSLIKSGVSLATKDISSVVKLLIDAEMKMFQGLPTPIIFLQNVVTDLLLGMGFDEAFTIFADHVKEKYGAEPGFITMNMPRLLDVLERLGIENPIICANINKIGFRMSGGIPLYEEVIKNRKFRPIAMSVLASGALSANDAISYIASLEKVESVVFGASSIDNIRKTKRALDEHFIGK